MRYVLLYQFLLTRPAGKSMYGHVEYALLPRATSAFLKWKLGCGSGIYVRNRRHRRSPPATPYTHLDSSPARDMSQFPDYYAVLNIPKTATTEEIRTAYKKESLRYALVPPAAESPKARFLILAVN